MPVLRHAKKKLRQDKKRTIQNKKIKEVYRSLVKKAKEEKTPDAINKAFSSLDKAVKKNLLHKNKVAHMKSALSKTVAEPAKKVVAPAKKPKVASKKKASSKKSK
jgi:small subunit ribosomal protein S20